MTLKSSALYLTFAAGLAGCSAGPSIQPDLPNSLTALFYNDSTGALLMKGGVMHTYANARCEGAQQVAHNISMGDDETLTTMPYTPGTPLTFSLTTQNAQSFKGNWGCTFTSTFTPVPGARYTATLQTIDDNKTCQITIVDQNNVVVPATSPTHSCTPTMGGIVRNGTRYTYTPPPVTIYVPR